MRNFVFLGISIALYYYLSSGQNKNNIIEDVNLMNQIERELQIIRQQHATDDSTTESTDDSTTEAEHTGDWSCDASTTESTDDSTTESTDDSTTTDASNDIDVSIGITNDAGSIDNTIDDIVNEIVDDVVKRNGYTVSKQDHVNLSVKIILEKAPPDFSACIGIILGSGMGNVAKSIENAVYIPYKDLSGFSESTVSGHAGNVVIGTLNGVDIACLQGRVHNYEGGCSSAVIVPINTLKQLGCKILLATAAVGSLNENVGPGSIVVVKDHINFQGVNPLVGPNDETFGCRFPSLQNAYDKNLRNLIHKAGKEAEIREMTEGVYCSCLGPSFETPAEVKMIKIFGADVVGMSLVGEIIAARHCGMRCSALAVVVNLAEGMSNTKITHEETLHYTAEVAESVAKLTTVFVKLAKESLNKKNQTHDKIIPYNHQKWLTN